MSFFTLSSLLVDLLCIHGVSSEHIIDFLKGKSAFVSSLVMNGVTRVVCLSKLCVRSSRLGADNDDFDDGIVESGPLDKKGDPEKGESEESCFEDFFPDTFNGPEKVKERVG